MTQVQRQARCPACGGGPHRDGDGRGRACVDSAPRRPAAESHAAYDAHEVHDCTLLDAQATTMKMAPLATASPTHRSRQDVPLELPVGLSIALEATGGPARGRVFCMDRRAVVIGREEGEIRIPDPMISRRHACLEVHDLETIILRDLSSTNGTYHNDQLIAFCRIEDGDEIRVGSTTLSVSLDRIG